MSKNSIIFLVVMLSHMAASAWAHAMDDGVSDNRVIVCTNSGKRITEAEYRSINQRFIKKIAIKQVPDDADTIYRAAVQVTCYPLCKDVLQESFLTPENEDKRIILSSADLSGEIEIKKIEKIKKSDMYRIHLSLNADGVIRPKFLEGFEYPVRIKDADIRLGLVERADLRPCLFAIDYSWPDNYILAKQ